MNRLPLADRYMALRPIIRRRMDVLERDKDALFAMVDKVPASLLTESPGEGKWTALQAINHVYLSELLSIQYVKHKLTKPETIPVRRPDAWFRTLLLKWILYSPLRFKSPPQINMWKDQPVLSLHEVKEAWAKLRKELVGLLGQHEPKFRRRLVYRQPFAGRMTLHQMLIFFKDHQAHHARQVRNILGIVRQKSRLVTAK